jgi:hypothetical protein
MHSLDKNQIKQGEWESMNIDQLMDQKTIMLDRYEFLIARGYSAQSKILLDGIYKIDSIILSI